MAALSHLPFVSSVVETRFAQRFSTSLEPNGSEKMEAAHG